MTEVSCRAFSYFSIAAERGLLDVDQVLAGLPVTRAELEVPSGRVAWDVWSRMCDRAAEQLGRDPQRLSASGRLTMETGEQGFTGYLGPAASLFTSSEDVYDLMVRWGAPSLFHSHTFGLDHLPDGRLRFRASLKPGLRPCLAWFQMVPGAVAGVPSLLGLPDATAVVESIDPTSIAVVVTPPPGRTLFARLRKLLRLLRSSKAVGDELAFQQQQLNQTIEALRRTEGGFRAALDALPVYVALHVGGRVVYANPALCRATGRSQVGLHGELVSVVLDPRDPLPVRPGEVVALRLLTVEGTARAVEVGALPPFDFGGNRADGLFAFDVTERRVMEETQRLLLSALPDLLVRVSPDLRLRDVYAGRERSAAAEAFRGLLGRPLAEVVGLVPGVTPEHLSDTLALFERVRAVGRESSTELVVDVDQRRFFEVRATMVEGGDVLFVVREITSQKRTERQLAVSERMASVGSLAAGMAHEINNPLTYILGNQELLDEGLRALQRGEPVDVGQLRELLAEVRQGTGRVRDIVASLRVFSRVDTDAAQVPVDVVLACERAVTICANELLQHARLERELSPVPLVVGDESRLIQVLVNLLMNAVQAMPVGRRENVVRVATRVDAAGRVCIEVGDNGVGIRGDVLKRIFDPFFTTKPPGKGTGLGLSISHRIVEDLGGTLQVASEPGVGSTFTLVLPPSLSASPAPEPPPTPGPGRSARVLVVDDDPLVARTLRNLLSRAGHQVVIVTRSEEALELVLGQAFDVVLCDLMMPTLSGMDLYTRARAANPSMADRFVFVSGGAFTEESQRFVEETARPVLGKPFNRSALLASVEQVMDAPPTQAGYPADTVPFHAPE